MATRRKAPAGTIQVDFSKMKEGGGVRLPEGDYLAKIISVKPDTSQNNNPMLVFSFEVIDGKHKGKKLLDRATLTDKALFKLRDILEALGINVPRKVVNIPIKKLVGKEIGLTVVDDEPYNGRIKSTVADYIAPDAIGEEDEDDEDEDDLEDPDAEDDEETEEDDLADLSRAELKALIKDEELEVTVKKSMTDDDLREAIEAARDNDEDDEEEDDEEEPAAKSKAKKKPKDEDDDELEDIDLSDL